MTKALEDTEAIEGGSLVLLCKTSKPCHIVWNKDGCLIWNSSKYLVCRSGNEARLAIRDVKDSDAGVYECDAGSVSTKATVTVKGISNISFLQFTTLSFSFSKFFEIWLKFEIFMFVSH